MADFHFRVKADLVVGGKMCSPCEYRPENAAGGARAGDITKFYVASWVGAGSETFSLSPVLENGVAEVRLRLEHGDVDTVKFAVAFGLATPKCVRCCHLASSFAHVGDLLRMLSEPDRKKRGFTADQACLKLADNFTRNTALLRVLDVGTDLTAAALLRLRPSSLLRLDEANEAVKRLGAAVEQQVCSCAVSPLNAGSQFVQSFTYGHLSGHLTHYALLGYLFDCVKSPISLGVLVYNAFQAMHSTNLGFDVLRGMSDAELVKRFGLAHVSRITADALVNVYCPDMTIAATGKVAKVRDTEDIAKSFSRLNFEVQNDGRLGRLDGEFHATPSGDLQSAVRDIVDYQNRLAAQPETFGARRATPLSCADDCENDAQCMMEQANALRDLYRACGSPEAVAVRVRAAVAQNPEVFAHCTGHHLAEMSGVLFRLGRMLDQKQWSMALAVASAKGPSYSESNPQAGEGLCGHGACIARVFDAQKEAYQHFPVEGTTYLTVDMPPPEGYPTSLQLKLSNGTVQSFPLETVGTVLAQNIHELVGLSAHAMILAHLRSDYGDQPLQCPFYVSTFYTSLSEGKEGSLGCIPLDTCPPPSFQAGSLPLFGAPVMGLSNPGTIAIPVTAEMLAGHEGHDPKDLANLLRDQVSEAWGPGVTEASLSSFLTYQQPVKCPDSPSLTLENYARVIRSENTWAFDDPKLTAKAVLVYSALAERFNALQAEDPASDHATARAYGQYLSACLNVCLPIPRDPDAFALSTVRNLRKASEDVGLTSALAACVFKTSMIKARAEVETDHHFYMCDKGEGLVHSHRLKLSTE